MTTYARIVSNVAIETFVPPTDFALADCFPPSIAALFTVVPDGTLTNATLSGGVWTNPAPVPYVAPPPPPNPTTITTWAFLNRFTAAEQLAVQTACNASVQLQVGLTQALANTNVNLLDPVVPTWMAGLVTAGAITAARSAVILTP